MILDEKDFQFIEQKIKDLNNKNVLYSNSEKHIMERYEFFLNYIYSVCEKHSNQEKIIEVLLEKTKGDFITVPASTRRNYHSAFSSGLAYHSLIVLYFLERISEQYGDLLGYKPSNDEIINVALLHDFGKVRKYKPIESRSRWHDIHKIEFDLKEEDENNAGQHSFISLMMLNEYNYKLTPVEYQAIFCHDGPILEQNKILNMKEHPLSSMLHMADKMAVIYEKRIIN